MRNSVNAWGPDFDPQPTLVGPSVTLDPTLAGDWDGLFAVAADPLIWALHPAHDRWQESVFKRFFDEGRASGGMLTIRDRQSRTIIGSSRFDISRTRPGEVEIGWTFLARSHWGGTTNAEVKRLMIGRAAGLFDTVVFTIGAANTRSRRAIEKLGGVLMPDRQMDVLMAGVPTSHVVYAIRCSAA